MTDRIQRQLELPVAAEEAWEAITADSGWLAEEVRLDLQPGGDAHFRFADGSTREGWVEEAHAPERLAFWWNQDGAPATRVELTIDRLPDGCRVRVVETRPLDRLDLIGTPLPGSTGRSYGPALVAA